MSRVNSRQKGARGERLAAALFRKHGFTARRGQQFKGGPDSPDIVVEGLPGWHWEIKVGYPKGPNPAAWLDQAEDEAPADAVPVVLYKPPRRPWCAFVRGRFMRVDLGRLDHPCLDFVGRTGACRLALDVATWTSEVVRVCQAEEWVEFDADALLDELRIGH